MAMAPPATPSAAAAGERWMVADTPRSESFEDSQCVPASQAVFDDDSQAAASQDVDESAAEGPAVMGGGGYFVPETQFI